MLTDAEMGNICLLRAELKHEIPTTLNTDFHLRRWLTAYNNDISACADKFREYLCNRRALGLDSGDFVQKYLKMDEVKRFSRFSTMSPIHQSWTNPLDNGIVFVEMPISDPKKYVRAVQTGQYLRCFMGMCEYFQYLILERERETGRPSHGICIYDQANSSLTPYLNPVGPINKLLQCRIAVWLDYYSELLKKVILVNSPSFLAAVWKIASAMLPKHIHDRFVFARHFPKDLLPYLDRTAIPAAYNGNLQLLGNSQFAMANACVMGDDVLESDFQEAGTVWEKVNVEPIYDHVTVKAGETFVTEGIKVKISSELVYDFHANGEVRFWAEIDGSPILPKFKINTTKLSEEMCVPVKKSGGLCLHFQNTSHYFALKIKLAYAVV